MSLHTLNRPIDLHVSSCYAHAPTRADGLDARSAAQIKADALEAQVSDMKAHSECDAAALATLEQQLEDAQDDLMSLLVAQPGFEDDGDDFDEMELAQLDTQSDFEELNGQESTSSGDHLALPPDVQSPSDEEADAQDEDDHVSNGTAREAIEAPDEPASFSRIPANVLHAHLAGQPIENSEFFDALKRAGMPLQVELKPGQMLYMPASWFHEVTSSGDKLQPHMAFN